MSTCKHLLSEDNSMVGPSQSSILPNFLARNEKRKERKKWSKEEWKEGEGKEVIKSL